MTCKPYVWLLSVCLWGLVFPGVGMACPSRIYQAAFYRWQPDDYHVTVEYSGELSKAPVEAVNVLRSQSMDDPGRANVRTEFRRVDGKGGNEPPVMQVSYVKHVPLMEAAPADRMGAAVWTNLVWSGPFTAETTARILDSPVRQELKKRLLAGDVAVWILLESGDKEKDDRTARLAEETVKDIRVNMKLPPLPAVSRFSAAPSAVAAGDKDIRLSLIRVSRDNPAESFLVTTIRRFLDDPKGDREPVLTPVFGRGMILKPLAGARLNPEAIRKVTVELLGHCTCASPLPHQARYLLMKGNWEKSAL